MIVDILDRWQSAIRGRGVRCPGLKVWKLPVGGVLPSPAEGNKSVIKLFIVMVGSIGERVPFCSHPLPTYCNIMIPGLTLTLLIIVLGNVELWQ